MGKIVCHSVGSPRRGGAFHGLRTALLFGPATACRGYGRDDDEAAALRVVAVPVRHNTSSRANSLSKSHTPPKAFSMDELIKQLTSKLGIDESVATGATAPAAAAGGGMLGKLAGMASTALGGSAGSGLELASSLTNAGVETDKLSGFVTMIVNYLKENVGDEVMDQVMAKFPMLKSLLG